MNMAVAGDSTSGVGTKSDKTTPMSIIAVAIELVGNTNDKRMSRKASESLSAPGSWRRQQGRYMWQQGQKVTRPHQTVERIVKMLDTYMARSEAQWLSMEVWLQDRE